MKQPDRFAHMANMLRLEYQASPWVDERNKWAALEQRVEKLLLHQHAAYVRLVKRTTNGGVDENMKANILAAMARYKKGTR